MAEVIIAINNSPTRNNYYSIGRPAIYKKEILIKVLYVNPENSA